MAEHPGKARDLGTGLDRSPEQGRISATMEMMLSFRASSKRSKIFFLTAALIVVVGATAYGQIRLNAWNQPFYDALAHKNLSAFMDQLGIFAIIAGLLLVLNVIQTWLNQTTKVTLREVLVDDLLNEWLRPLRAFRLSNAGEIGTNPDQRIHEDARHLTELTTDLGVGLLQATLLLLSFIGVLWGLSNGMVLSLGGHSFVIPGYMVWCALLYAGTASFLSWKVGHPLVSQNAERYAREAELRFALVRVNEHVDGIALNGGENDEKRYLTAVFGAVLEVIRRIVATTTRLTWITAGYGWFTLVAPIMVAAPGYFWGSMSFGELMMAVGAFNQVQQALRWFVDNFSAIADWHATFFRVGSFREALLEIDKIGESAGRIAYTASDDFSFRVEDLEIASPAGCIRLSENKTIFQLGERIHIIGEIGAGKTLLFRAFAGLWPWGSGIITHPIGRAVMFMPDHAYIPPGTLRACVTYPDSAQVYEDAAVIDALQKVGMGRYAQQLDRSERWDRRLTGDEKQCLAFARAVLQKPKWLVLDESFDALDRISRKRIEALFLTELADMGLINVGHVEAEVGFFTRTLHITTDPHGRAFKPAYRKGAAAQPKPAWETIPFG
jgi:putative ATP-binding cassette transporter